MARGRWMRVAVVALTAAVFAVPTGAHSSPFTSQIAQCFGIATPGAGETVCSVTFRLDTSRYPSDIETHANFHTMTASGTIMLEWYDQLQTLQARYTCNAPGLYVSTRAPNGDAISGGPADLSTIPNCRRDVRQSAYFASGIQTLIVRATAESCRTSDNGTQRCPFHGYLSLDKTRTV